MLERYMKDRGSEAFVTFFYIDRIYGRFPKHLKSERERKSMRVLIVKWKSP